jgi:hypothetical protein
LRVNWVTPSSLSYSNSNYGKYGWRSSGIAPRLRAAEELVRATTSDAVELRAVTGASEVLDEQSGHANPTIKVEQVDHRM